MRESKDFNYKKAKNSYFTRRFKTKKLKAFLYNSGGSSYGKVNLQDLLLANQGGGEDI